MQSFSYEYIDVGYVVAVGGHRGNLITGGTVIPDECEFQDARNSSVSSWTVNILFVLEVENRHKK